jgi:hypothetical protein
MQKMNNRPLGENSPDLVALSKSPSSKWVLRVKHEKIHFGTLRLSSLTNNWHLKNYSQILINELESKDNKKIGRGSVHQKLQVVSEGQSCQIFLGT